MKKYLLKELLEIKNGKDHKDLKDGTIPVFGSGGLMRYVDTAIYDGKSILLPRKGSLDNIQYVNGEFWTVDTLYYSIVDETKAVPFYLFNYINLLDLSNLNTGTGVPSMTFSSYYDIEVKLPSISTQKKIASVLSSLDDKIELNNKINAELEEMARTIYDYWFVQFDFPDENGNPYKSSGGKMVYNKRLGREIPEGWDLEMIEKLGTIISGSTPRKSNPKHYTTDGTPWITPKDLSMNTGNKFITRGENDVTEEGIQNASLTILPPFSVLMSSRAPIGYVAINRKECTTNQGFKSFFCNKDYPAEYVYYTLIRNMPLIEQNAGGSTFREISATALKRINIVKPPLKIVEEFRQIITPIFEKQNNLEKQNIELASLRDWLLPMLMNGHVRVGE